MANPEQTTTVITECPHENVQAICPFLLRDLGLATESVELLSVDMPLEELLRHENDSSPLRILSLMSVSIEAYKKQACEKCPARFTVAHE